MNLQTATQKAIKYINEHSTNGSLVSAAQNKDYTLRMNQFADDCQNEISDKVGINAAYTIDTTVSPASTANGYKKYNLPADFKEHRHVNLNGERFYDYKIENNQFLVYEFCTGSFELFYYKYPTQITDDTADSYVFEVDQHTHRLIPFYLGGMVIADEQPMISDKLLNIYYDGLGTARKRINEYPRRVRETTRWW